MIHAIGLYIWTKKRFCDTARGLPLSSELLRFLCYPDVVPGLLLACRRIKRFDILKATSVHHQSTKFHAIESLSHSFPLPYPRPITLHHFPPPPLPVDLASRHRSCTSCHSRFTIAAAGGVPAALSLAADQRSRVHSRVRLLRGVFVCLFLASGLWGGGVDSFD